MAKAKTKTNASKDMEKAAATWFDDETTKFKGLLRHALLIANRVGRQMETPPRGFATWLWLRSVITGQSIEKLLSPHKSAYGGFYLDQGSIATLCRGLIENVAVMRYIGDEDISQDEWKCRHYIINLYDVVHRTDFLSLIGGDYQGGERDRKILTRKLEDNAFFQTLPKRRQKRLMKGDDMFVDGRHNAMLELGWGDQPTRGVYKYLSAQAHSQSMAFQRTEDNKLYEKDSPYAKMVAAFGLAWTRLALGYGCVHMLTLFPRIESAFDPIIIRALKNEYSHDRQPRISRESDETHGHYRNFTTWSSERPALASKPARSSESL